SAGGIDVDTSTDAGCQGAGASVRGSSARIRETGVALDGYSGIAGERNDRRNRIDNVDRARGSAGIAAGIGGGVSERVGAWGVGVDGATDAGCQRARTGVGGRGSGVGENSM